MKVQLLTRKFMLLLVCSAMILSMSFLAGCKGSDGANGANGVSAPTTGTITGTVTAGTTAAALGDVVVTTTPVVSGATATTDATGNYTLTVPGGAYTVTFTKAKFTTGTANVNVANGVQSTLNAAMAVAASGNPTVTLSSPNNPGYGQAFSVTANATSNTGGTLSYAWTGATGDGATASATSQSFTSAFAGVAAPSTDPGGFVSPYVQEKRFGVLPINPDTRGTKSVSVKVTDGLGGSTTASVSVNSVPVQPGVRQVSVGIPVFLNSGVPDDTATVWNVVTTPSGTTTLSTAGTGTRNPWFVPAAPGAYIVSTGTGSTITLYAGNYAGAISGGGYTTKTVTTANGMWYSWAPSSTQSSMTFTNWPTVTPDAICDTCHDSTFAAWGETVHATFFSRGVENITSNGSTCTTCHTTGGSGGAGGYLETAASTTGYSYPTKATGAWAALVANYPTVARVTNIQCENCHGAQTDASRGSNTGHRTAGLVGGPTATTAARVSYSADVCGSCHSSGTGHHIYSEWNTLDPDTGYGHSNLATAINESTSSSCARCHTAQGYTVYLDNIKSGNIDSLAAGSMTWDKTNAQPQSCTACHDPHSDACENQLRVCDSTPMLPSGFSVEGYGKGALCVTCHNSRNGKITATTTFLHEDGQPQSDGGVYNGGNDPKGYSAPHQAAQGDVFAGRNAYFMGASLPMLSKHANVEDACVGCHIVLNPQTHLSHGAPAVSGHVMYIRDQDKAAVCANCHSSNVNGEALVASIESQLEVLAAKMEAAMLRDLITAQTTTSVAYTDGNTSATGVLSAVTTTTPITLEEVHGQIGFNIQGHDIQLGNFKKGSTSGTAVVPTSDPLVRAGWNYFLIEGDSSKGIHNPGFATQVLNNSIAQEF